MKHFCHSASCVLTNMQGNGHSNGRPQGETAANPLKENNNSDVTVHLSLHFIH